MNPIVMYTDGAAQGNPGKGGYGIVLISGNHRKEISQGYRHTTNNRMELLSVIVGLEALKKPGSEVTIFSDSKYVVDSVNKGWLFNWAKKNYQGKKNTDLWKRFMMIYPKFKIKFVWVKGHASNVENNRCDELAVAAAKSAHLLIDVNYEQDVNQENLFG
jgi:ribonuclease HI